ncbi:peptidase U32 family protein, partial [Methanosaeta sp. UBA356]|uniref:peptidase U32 family protein n=1 Tax=Methanosaeta sp. UBA356 TaxID=1915559 RepID=UPI0039B770E6
MRLPELLAPAGSPQALHSAIAAGADAVYLSGKRFGARKFAANFDHKAMTEAIDYAHLRGVKVYVTVNTLIREEELLDLAEYLVQLY